MKKVFHILILMSGVICTPMEANAAESVRISSVQQDCLASLGISRPTAAQQECVRKQMQELQAAIGSGIPTGSQLEEINNQVEAIQVACGLPSKDRLLSAMSQCNISQPSVGN